MGSIEHKNGTTPAREVHPADVTTQIADLAQLMTDIVTVDPSRQEWISMTIDHVSSALRNSISPQEREIVESRGYWREIRNA